MLVVGAGGLGVPVLSCLAGAGVGTLGIVEERVIESLDEARFGLIDARPA